MQPSTTYALETDELAARAQRVLPGGSTHVARTYTPRLYVARSLGSHKWLVDGRELIDYTMGHGALLLGHAHPAVVEAVKTQVARGTHYGAAHPLEVEWAELITSLVPSVSEVRFTASGTEATMLALRIARAATGRDTVAVLRDHFHGWYDAVSIAVDDDGRAVPTPGVPALFRDDTRVVDPAALETLAAALEDRQAAALILEVSGAHFGRVPLDPDFIRSARTLCSETGTMLVFDEVVTGFRVAPGGLQSTIGVTPDLTVFGKVMAGGLPGGAVGGRRDLLELLTSTIRHPGTFNANPLSAAAGVATLRIVADGAPQRAADGYARALENEWRASLQAVGVRGRVWRLSSIIHVALDDPALHDRLGDALRKEGIDLLHTSAFCSSVHSLADLDQSVLGFERALRDVADGT